MSDQRFGKKISDIYLSQEPALNPQRMGKTTENTFEGILNNVGFVVGEKNNANELNVDQAVFLRNLAKLLSEKNSSDIQNFIDGFESYLGDEIRLKWSLIPTITASTCETARNVSQDSLVHLLLNLEIIQEKVIAIMLAKLVEIAFCENTALYDRSEGKTVACLIISQFRWLSKLTNSTGLSEKLVELIEATPSEVQRDIIKLLPDVINEFDHPKVAKSLSSIFESNQELNICILDALTNFNIEPELLSDLREKVIDTLNSAEIEDLPILVKFVLQDVNTTEAPQLIRELREKLDFNSTFNPIISSTPLESKGKDISKSVENVVLNTIMHALKFQKGLCDAWIKHLDIIQGHENHKSLDIFIILIFLSLGINEKKIEGILKNKLKNSSINDDLLKLTFRCHHDMLQEYAQQLLKLSESLLRSIEPVISSFGSSVYIECFVWFNAFFKQEVIGNLITHVGNKSENEVNAALDTLLALARSHPQKLLSFALFIKNLLDHLNDLPLNQVRKVHEMLSILAYQGGREGSMLLDDILIIIRKQLNNKNLKYRKMGVIGALMAAKTAAEKVTEETFDHSISSDALDFDSCCQNAIKLLELAAHSTSESSEAYALFCDELSHIMLEKELGQAIFDWVGGNILSDFEQIYITDVNPEVYVGKSFGPKFALDVVDDPVAIDLYTLAEKELQGQLVKSSKHPINISSLKGKGKSRVDKSHILKTLINFSNLQESSESDGELSKVASPLKLAPMFRLLRIYRKIHEGNLDAIDAILGCAIIVPELKYQKFSVLSSNTKHLVLNVLFYSINWIRENINAFAVTHHDDIKCNVLNRLHLLIELESLACNYIGDVNGYTPPMANFDCEEQSLSVLKLKPKKSVKRSLKGKSKQAKKSKANDSMEQNDTTSNDCSKKSKSLDSESEVEPEFEAKEESKYKVLKSLQPFFRELDLEVFTLLQLEIMFKNREDAFSSEKVKSAQLHVNELKFLLEDLSAKLHHSLNPIATHLRGPQQHVSFSNIESCSNLKIANFSIELIPSLCSILDEFLKYFKTIQQEADGIEDSLALFTTETQSIMKCMNLVFKVLKQIMSWKGFILNENAALLQKALAAFVLGDQSKNALGKDIINSVMDRLTQNSEFLPSLSCAANLIELLSRILTYSSNSQSKLKVSVIALKFLQKKWCDFDSKTAKAAEMNGYVRIILEAFLYNNKSILKGLDFLSAEAVPQLLDKENEVVFHTLNKSSLGMYYKIIVANLARYIKSYFPMRHSDDDQIYEWSVSFKVFQVFTNLLKSFGSRSNIGACLKASREILQTFLRHGMPLMDKLYVDNKEDVITLMKTLQISTRYLQHVCCHSKVLKDVTLIKHVPFLKKSLELFVFRVKSLLAVNKCEDAFWLGNLKNRDLKGEEILSQEIQEDDENDNDDSDVDEEEKVGSESDASDVDSSAEIL